MEDRDGPIVVGVDGSDHSDRALRWAVREAQLRRATLTLVHAHGHAGISAASAAAVARLADRLVDDVVDRHRALLSAVEWDTVIAAAPAGSAAQALLDAGRGAQMIVMGTRGLGGFTELLLGSTSHRVLMHASTPVALIRTVDPPPGVTAEEHDGLRPIVVGVDHSREAQGALRWALDEASRRDVSVLVVHGLDAPSAATLQALGLPVELVAARLADARAAARDEVDEQIHRALPMGAEVKIDRVIDDASAVVALQRYAAADHLLVVGTRGRRGFAELGPGSVSHQCAHHAAGPMVAVPYRPDGPRSAAGGSTPV